MAERVTDAKILGFVKRMQDRGMDIGIDGQYGRWRVTNREGGRNISPRASNREILDWLDAFRAGYDEAWDKAYWAGVSDMHKGELTEAALQALNL